MRDEREQAAHEKGLQYVGLDGSVGIIANGAGLAMSTLDVVNQVGGDAANFLDIGGGANADVMAGALEVINDDPRVKSIFINIFGGITRGEEVANGIVEALGRVTIDAPIVIRLDGTNADEGRAILEPHLSDKLQSQAHHARGRPGRRRARRSRRIVVRIFVDETTKVVYQGLTGSQGRFYGLRNRDYGTQVVAGTSPKKAGTDVDGIPIFANVAEAVAETGATASCIFIPAPGRQGRGDRGGRGRHRVHRRHHRGRARRRTRRGSTTSSSATTPSVQLLGPNCPGIISPGKCNIGITAGEIAKPGGPVGIVSRSGTLTYQALYELKLQDIGVTTCVGIGGDPVPGTTFIDCLERVRGRPRHQGRHDDRRDRWLGRGRGGRVHHDQDDQAGRRPTSPASPRRPARRWATPAPSSRAARARPRPRWTRSQAAGVRVGRNPTEAGELMVEIVQRAFLNLVVASPPSDRLGGTPCCSQRTQVWGWGSGSSGC